MITMEIELTSLSSTLPKPLFSRSLSPGDRIVVKVLQRLSPFRYLVRFRGHPFTVTSTALLKPGHSILLELLENRPRFKFKFIASLRESSNQLMEYTGAQNHPLLSLLEEWAVRWEFPIKTKDFTRFKRLYREKKLIRNFPHSFLLSYFFLLQNATDYPEEYRQAFQEWLFEQTPLPDSPRQSEENATAPTLHLSTLLKQPDQLPEILSGWLNYTHSPASGQAGDAHPPQQEILSRFIQIQVQRFRAGLWMYLPFKSSNHFAPHLTFWRRRTVHQSKSIEFAFIFSGKHLAPVGVMGELTTQQLRVKIVSFSNQDIMGFVDDNMLHLLGKLRQAGYPAPRITIHTDKEPFAWLGNLIFGAKNRIEVLI